MGRPTGTGSQCQRGGGGWVASGEMNEAKNERMSEHINNNWFMYFVIRSVRLRVGNESRRRCRCDEDDDVGSPPHIYCLLSFAAADRKRAISRACKKAF